MSGEVSGVSGGGEECGSPFLSMNLNELVGWGGEDGVRAEVNRRLIIAGADPSIGKITWWDEPEDVRVFRWERDAGVWSRVWGRLRRWMM